MIHDDVPSWLTLRFLGRHVAVAHAGMLRETIGCQLLDGFSGGLGPTPRPSRSHDAFDCYQRYIFAEDRVGRELFAEAAAWLSSTIPDGLFSFESISETLGIDPKYFRRSLAAWHKRGVEMQPAAPIAEAASDTSASRRTPPRAVRR